MASIFVDNFREFAKDNIRHLICKTCAPEKNKHGAENLCGCGRDVKWHTEKNLFFELNGQKWDPKLHTTSVAPACFGEIEFSNFGVYSNFAKFARIHYEMPAQNIWHMLQHVWQLETPKLVVSVTGGARKLQLKPRLQHAFTQGLINVASSTDAWIISAGMSAGVMQWVGQAVYEYQLANKHVSNKPKMVALAIAPWGCVDNCESLEGQPYEGCFPAQYSFHTDSRDVDVSNQEKNNASQNISESNQANPKRDKTGKVPLDHNHTHFLLVDNGTDSVWGTEIELRARLEAQIANTLLSDTIKSKKIPVVMVVCEGGDKTLTTVWDATAQHSIPAVIMKGSGRAADLICTAYKVTRARKLDDSLSVIGDSFDETFSKLISMAFNWKEDHHKQKILTSLQELKDLLSKRNLLTIFELDDLTCRDLDKAVLTALLKAHKNSAENQINLALAWDKADVAKEYIFTMENRTLWQNFSLNDSMLDALLKERADFVQLFMENGINLNKFLNTGRLKVLYQHSLNDDSCRMASIIKFIIKSSSVFNTFCWFRKNQVNEANNDDLTLKNIEKVLRCLLDDKFAYVDLTHRRSDSNNVSNPEQRNSLKALMHLNQMVIKMDPYMDLFTWCLLFNKQQLAYFFWKSCRDPIGAALFACNILKSLSVYAADREELDLSSSLLDQAGQYENMAADILCICYSKDKATAQDLLTRNLNSTWLGTTLFSFAENASLMKFMQLSCCQTKLNKIWTGALSENTPDWKVILSLIPGLIFILKFRKDNELESTPTGEVFDCEIELENQDNLSTYGDKEKTIKYPHSNNGTPGLATQSERKKKGKFLFSTLAFCNGSNAFEPDSIGCLKAYYKYFRAPVTKFYVNSMFYTMFLALFTYVTLEQLHPLDEDVPQVYVEFIVWFWMLTLWVEEFHEIIHKEAKSIWFKIFNHFSSFWNQMDFFMFAFFLVSVVLRCLGGPGKLILYAKVTYALSLMVAYLRLMETFYVSKVMGPKIIAIEKMLKDLLVFACLLIIFILSFGVAMQAILYSKERFNFHIFLSTIYSPYWQVFTGANVAKAEGREDSTCSDNDTALSLDPSLHPCPRSGYLVPALLAAYILLTNILLVNLLIAMFSDTFQKVQGNSEQLWRFYRYSLIKFYYEVPALPAPLIVISHVTEMIMYCCPDSIKRKLKKKNAFAITLNEHDNNRLSAFEKAGQETYLAITDKRSMDSTDNRLMLTKEKLDQAIDQLDEIRDKIQIDVRSSPVVQPVIEMGNSKIDGNSHEVHQRLNVMERKLDEQNETLKMLVRALDKELNILKSV